MTCLFRDRRHAGQLLGDLLAGSERGPDVLVLGLPRGGVPVAAEVARALDAQLDTFVVRKLGVPGNPEYAMGAIAKGGVRLLDEALIGRLRIPESAVQEVLLREELELERRERVYRGGLPPPGIPDRTVIVVDDGLATGATMRAALAALRVLRPARLVAACPVAPPDVCAALWDAADKVVCLCQPEPFHAVGEWYDRFDDLTDDDVHDALRAAAAHVGRSQGRGNGSRV